MSQKRDYPSVTADRFIIRLPDGWRDTIKIMAARNRRSMNQEILAALESVVGEAAGGEIGVQAPAAEQNQPRSNAADFNTADRKGTSHVKA